MKKVKNTQIILLFVAILGISVIPGCAPPASVTPPGDTTAPVVVSTTPINTAVNVALNSILTATFSEDMDPATIIASHFTLTDGITPMPGTVTYDLPTKKATFAPAGNLTGSSTVYTATVTTGVTDLAGNALAANKVWTFTTISASLGPAPVVLGTASNFVILAKSAIVNIAPSLITGNLGLSPAAETFITGFSQTDFTGYATSPQVTGFIYAADMAPPTPANLTIAIADMETAYTDAAGRLSPDFTDLNSGNIGGLTLNPGLYRWGSAVSVATDITISGTALDVWIFQITGAVTVAASVNVNLGGGALAKNIYWQIAGAVTVGANASFKGIVLGATAITMGNQSTLDGRILVQTQASLDQSTIIVPAP